MRPLPASTLFALAAVLLLLAGCGERAGSGSENGNGGSSGNGVTAQAGPEPAGEAPPKFQLSTRGIEKDRADLQAAYDPAQDGWTTEALHDAISAQLHDLGDLIGGEDPAAGNDLDDLAADRIEAGELRPANLEPAGESPPFRTWRGTASADSAIGKAALAGRLNELRQPFAGPPERVSLKEFRIAIEDGGGSAQSRAFYAAAGKAADGSRVEQHAVWECRWAIPAAGSDAPPTLLAARAAEFEESMLAADPGRLFADCTAAAFAGAVPEPIRFGANYWHERIVGFPTQSLQGISVGDADGDGREDVYVAQGSGLPNRLLLHQADGTVKDGAAEAGVDFLDTTRAALFLDLDNDGDQDLAISTSAHAVILENDGGGRFAERARIPVTEAMSLAAADIDADGLLDLYVCAYNQNAAEVGPLASPAPYYDATNGAPNLMLRNTGEFRFEDVTDKSGLAAGNSRFSFAAAFEDFDRDGDLDLYVSNDFGRNNLYRNVGDARNPKFADEAGPLGVEDSAFGMSVAWGDANRDGRPDVYISNMFSKAGNRVTYQRKFMPGEGEAVREKMQYLARGNSLFLNRGDGGFEDASEGARVMKGSWAWASLMRDVNNDGWQDILGVNGFQTSPGSGDL
ncbi:MAG: VCBS repeat-containing protein [Verrucomicrobiales bacterium]